MPIRLTRGLRELHTKGMIVSVLAVACTCQTCYAAGARKGTAAVPAPRAPIGAASAAVSAAPSGGAPTAPGSPTVPGAASLPLPTLPAVPVVNGPTYTLDQVVGMALDHNSVIQLARLRVDKAQQSIYQTDAAGYPQVRADVADTLSSTRQFGANAGGSTQAITLPGGGAIPVVVDQGGNTTGTSTGIANAGGTTAFSPTVNAGSAGGTAPTVSSTGAAPVNSTTGIGSSPTTGGIGTGAGGTSGGTGAGTAGTGSVGSHALPQVVRDYVNAAQAVPTAKASTSAVTSPTDPVSTVGGRYNNYGARLSVTQGIDLFRLVPTARRVESVTRDFYVIDLARVSNELALTVKNTFFSVLRAQQLLATQQEQVAAATESLRIANVQFAAGVAAQFDVVTAQTTLSNAQQLESSAANQLDLALANLNNLVGNDLDTPINLVAPDLGQNAPTPALRDSVTTAYANRPELQQAANNLIIARSLITLADAGMKPSLGLSGSADFAGLARPGIPQTTFTLTADLGIPLYDGGATRTRVKSAQIDLRTQEVNLGQLRQNVSLEVRTALSNIADAKSRIASAQQGVTQASEALRLANIRYQNEEGTFLEVTNAQANLATARNNLANAQFDLGNSEAQLTRALGSR